MRRVFQVDVRRCTHCGGRRKLIAFITTPPDIRRILLHLKLPADPPAVAPARPPPQLDFAFLTIRPLDAEASVVPAL
ncbi:MAG: hypothetical protein ACI8QC_000559 [Planctomycetota bacterium]|jgi:hypothetical protein